MTPGESRLIGEGFGDLSMRLFGEDGQGGSLGRIEAKLDVQDGRITQLERDRIAREAVAAAGGRIDRERHESWRWRVTTIIAMCGSAAAVVLGLLSK